MKRTIALVLAAIVLVGGEWAYRTGYRPADPLTQDVLALAEHFRVGGIEVRAYPVRNGFPHSVVIAAAAFEIKGYPLPVSIEVCPNAAVAATHLVNVANSPNLMGPMQNGRLVMVLPMWGDDTGEMARKVHACRISSVGDHLRGAFEAPEGRQGFANGSISVDFLGYGHRRGSRRWPIFPAAGADPATSWVHKKELRIWGYAA